MTTVQWLRFGQNAYLQMFAIVKKGAWNDVFPRLRQIRDSIEPKSLRYARPAGHDEDIVVRGGVRRGLRLGPTLRHADQRRAQHPFADGVAGLHDLHDRASRHVRSGISYIA